jgi:hypothetical protein
MPMTEEERAAEDAKWAAGKAQRQAEQAKEARKIAFTQESDPIYFQWQRGEATEKEWLDKVEEIRARYPES